MNNTTGYVVVNGNGWVLKDTFSSNRWECINKIIIWWGEWKDPRPIPTKDRQRIWKDLKQAYNLHTEYVTMRPFHE